MLINKGQFLTSKLGAVFSSCFLLFNSCDSEPGPAQTLCNRVYVGQKILVVTPLAAQSLDRITFTKFDGPPSEGKEIGQFEFADPTQKTDEWLKRLGYPANWAYGQLKGSEHVKQNLLGNNYCLIYFANGKVTGKEFYERDEQ